MPDKDDPFGFDDSDTGGRTVVKPIPGGMPGQFDRQSLAGRESPPAPPGPARVAQNIPWPLSAEGGLNPIERAASPLIGLLSQLASAPDHPDPEALRERVKQEIGTFENAARMAGVSPEDLYVARYVLCTAIDEAVLNTPWGANSNWDMQTLLVTFHKESQGGVRFFQLLKQLSQDPRRHLHLLELLYILLALGFKGKYRHADDGYAALEGLREQLYREIRMQRGEPERALSPNWRGEGVGYRPLTRYVPWWVIASGLGVFLLAVYGFLTFKLGDDVVPAYGAIASIGVDEMPRRTLMPVPPEPLPVVPPPEPEKTLSDLLRADLAAGLITIEEDPLTARIVVRGDGLFRSGSIRIREEFSPLLKRVAEALDAFPGRILISGHTDNVPIRTLRFPSNWHLSRARAKSVLTIMTAAATNAHRYEAEGRGEREPLVANDTPANRALNRRVEITLFKHAATPEPVT